MADRKPVIIFDLFGTILKSISNDYHKGLEYLANEIISNFTIEDIESIAEEYRRKYMTDRIITNREASMIQQLELFRDRLSFNMNDTLQDIEYNFFEITRICEINDNLIDVLNYLKYRGYLIFVMSNTVFSAMTIKKKLERFGIGHYFEDVFTSSDFGYRKPSRIFFSAVYKRIYTIQKIKKSDIIFVGDQLEKDVLGSRTFGFFPIWLSSQSEEDRVFLADCIRVSDLNACKDFIESNLVYLSGIQNQFSTSDGPGNRLVIYFQGCGRQCKGCHNQRAWSPNKGKRFFVKDLAIHIVGILSKYIKNVTISGGEPLDQEKAVKTLIDILSKAELNVCLYTSRAFNEVPEDIKNKIHYLKTGEFVQSLRDTTNGYFGSSNQKMWKKENNIWQELRIK
jgi:anaerobic ribonucleoside-triphosphate reductase activating protein